MKTRQLETLVDVRRAAMDLLARREHSYLELVRKLQPRVEDKTILADALDQLVEDNLLDDARFCEAFVRSRMNKGYGRVRIIAELKERGVEEGLIAGEMRIDEDIWQQHLAEVIEKKYGAHLEDDTKSRARQQRFLMQRGFTYEQINRALAQFKAS